MKATFQIPDDLYREVKALTALEGRTLRDGAIGLFDQWLRQKHQHNPQIATVDWMAHEPPLARLMPGDVSAHSAAAMRKSITSQWNEPT